MNGEKCRHGVELCYRCGVFTFSRDVKPTNQPPYPRSTKRKLEPPKVCIHRSEAVAKLDCSCAGAREAYECPIHPDKIIILVPFPKPMVKIIGTGQQITIKDCFWCSACPDYSLVTEKTNG